MDLQKIQSSLRSKNIDGWLLYDFHNRDMVAYNIMGLDGNKHTSRRWFYLIPSEGEPTAILSKVEPSRLDGAAGKFIFYRSWKDLYEILGQLLGNTKHLAMNYSPMNNIPYVSTVDAGTLELIRSFGPQIVSSADLIQEFESLLSPERFQLHARAGDLIQRIKDEVFSLVEKTLQKKEIIKEIEVQRFILNRFDQEGLDCMGELPIVGVNEHPANPHFEPTLENSYQIKKGDTLLIDLWAKLAKPGGIFYDITWCAFVGQNPPQKYVEIFNVVCQARDTCLEFIRDQVKKKGSCKGCDADDVCRKVVEDAGYGNFFLHRTGHSIGEEVHWTGANIDNLETKDERKLVPGCCFSIEPGIYLENEMAVRTEINAFIRENREVDVVGPIQKSLICMDV